VSEAGADERADDGSEKGDAALDVPVGNLDSGGGEVTDGGLNVTPDVGVPPLDPAALLRNLTMQQISELCDWRAAAFGGYNMNWRCGFTSPDNAQCVSMSSRGYPSYCDQTVADVVACAYAQLAELPSCEIPAECVVLGTFCPEDSSAGSDGALGE
jgi:hypothetical protein